MLYLLELVNLFKGIMCSIQLAYDDYCCCRINFTRGKYVGDAEY